VGKQAVKNKEHSFRFFFLLWLFSSLITAGGFLLHGKLYWDTGKIFTELRDQWHSLNVFGEPAWWFPHVQSGMPGYYHSILGLPSCLNPVFAMTGFVVWILGRLGIFLQKYQPLYVLYFGFLIPFFFLHAVWLLAKRVLQKEWVVQYVLILAAFSPGILFNVSDVGYLEPTIYSLYFASAYWDFLRNRGRGSKTLLLLAWGLVVLSFNHGALYWNLFAIPLFLFVMPVKRTTEALSQISLKGWAIFIVVSLICFAPNAIVYLQGRDLVRSTLGETLQYPIERLAAGNPLEIFSVSFPGFGFDWNSDRTRWTLMPLSAHYHTSYYYLGLLALPLFLLGLLRASFRVKRVLFLFAFVFMGVLPLSAHSPLFAPLLLFGPLKSSNHFSDAAFKAGAFLIVIFGAGFGLRAMVRLPVRKVLLVIFILTVFVMVLLQIWFFGSDVFGSASFGIYLFCAVFFFILLVWLLRSKRLRFQETIRLLLLLTLLDVGTHSFLWVRNIWRSTVVLGSGWPAYHFVDETPSENGLGIRIGAHSHFYTNNLLMLRPYYQMLRGGKNPFLLPQFALRRDGQQLPANVQIVRQSYNDLVLEIGSKQSGTLFIRDGYSPFWKATVNGQSVRITSTPEGFKEISVPPGVGRVVLRFSPPWVSLAIFAAYALLLCFAAISFLFAYKKHNRRTFRVKAIMEIADLSITTMKNGLFFISLVILFSARPALAYIDPGSGQLVWQFLQASLVGSLFFVGRFTKWIGTLLRKRLAKKTSLDEISLSQLPK
jgi:hypothetical protein